MPPAPMLCFAPDAAAAAGVYDSQSEQARPTRIDSRLFGGSTSWLAALPPSITST